MKKEKIQVEEPQTEATNPTTEAVENEETKTQESVENTENIEAQPLSEVDDLKNKLSELNDRFLRLYSEFDNYKKRTVKERLDLIRTAGEDIIKSLLPVMDDLDRAVRSFEQTTDVEPIKEGVVLIHTKFKNLLQQKGLNEMESAIGQELNTDFHEAITSIPAPNEELKGKVVDVVEKGYQLNEKVIRYAKVVMGN